MKRSELRNRRVCVVGLGREGLSVLNAIRECGAAELAVCDRDPGAAARLPQWAVGAVDVLSASPDLIEAAGYDVLIKSPGIPPRTPGIRSAKERGAIVTTPTAIWFAEAEGAEVVGVTGTKGKSTTATLIHRCLVGAGRNAHLLGNIGRPAVDLFPIDAGATPVFVVELSSFQLHGLHVSPRIAVLLNLYTDHLDWHDSRDDYVAGKLGICASQGEDGVLIYHGADPGIRATKPGGKGRRIAFATLHGFRHDETAFWKGPDRLFDVDALGIPGMHNRDNACAVLAVLEELGIDPIRAEETFRGFRGLPHRLELVREYGGVRFINDSIATGPDAAIRAMDAYPDVPKVVLLGGNAKGVSLGPLVERIAKPDIRGIVLMQESGVALERMIGSRSDIRAEARSVASMEEAVTIANELTIDGGIVLLAPGGASMAPFRDYIDRGERFKRAVCDL